VATADSVNFLCPAKSRIMNQHNHNQHHGRYQDGRAKACTRIGVAGRGLMLTAIVIYVLTMDESIRPGQPEGQAMPAADAQPR
jgi:hypothetical protein